MNEETATPNERALLRRMAEEEAAKMEARQSIRIEELRQELAETDSEISRIAESYQRRFEKLDRERDRLAALSADVVAQRERTEFEMANEKAPALGRRDEIKAEIRRVSGNYQPTGVFMPETDDKRRARESLQHSLNTPHMQPDRRP